MAIFEMRYFLPKLTILDQKSSPKLDVDSALVSAITANNGVIHHQRILKFCFLFYFVLLFSLKVKSSDFDDDQFVSWLVWGLKLI